MHRNLLMEPYRVADPDYRLSPRTGMTRRHWIEAARYIVDRIFLNVPDADSLFEFPVIDGRPNPAADGPEWLARVQDIEGFRRTMSVAVPLLHVCPATVAHGIPVADYYRRHIVRLLTPGGEGAIPMPGELDDEFYQFTCELGGMCQVLLRYPDQFWPKLSGTERDAVAEMFHAWGHHRTQPHNWRFFNVMMLTFLKVNGYDIDDRLLETHLDALMSFYGGDGWYDDGHYDYYSVWVFHIYSLIWNQAYGNEHEPDRAAIHRERFQAFMKSYPRLFGRDGRMLMWGRSICYRMAAACAFPISFFDDRAAMDPGWARRLCSGTLRQFLLREDMWHDNVPSLGFYRHWEPLTQPYSNAASPFWMMLPFVGLSLPEDSPYWTATENDGPWESLGDRSDSLLLDHLGLNLTNHGSTGTTELRPGNIHTPNHNYNRLAYNSHFVWETDNPDGATPMAYSIRGLSPKLLDRDPDPPFLCQTKILGAGTRDGVLYRQLELPDRGHRRRNMIDAADIPVPGGMIRVDRCRVYHEHELRLGHYGLGHADGEFLELNRAERDEARSITARAGDRSLAVTAYHGWDRLDCIERHDTNADTLDSRVLYLARRRDQWAPAIEIMISVFLHRTDGDLWSEDELFPLAAFRIERFDTKGSVGVTHLTLRDGSTCTIDFDRIDSKAHG